MGAFAIGDRIRVIESKEIGGHLRARVEFGSVKGWTSIKTAAGRTILQWAPSQTEDEEEEAEEEEESSEEEDSDAESESSEASEAESEVSEVEDSQQKVRTMLWLLLPLLLLVFLPLLLLLHLLLLLLLLLLMPLHLLLALTLLPHRISRTRTAGTMPWATAKSL